MVFLPKKQKVAVPAWMHKHTKMENGKMVVTCKRGQPHLLQLRFQPATLSGPDEINYVSGGDFYLSGPNFPSALVKCVALRASDTAAAPWRLEEYDDNDDNEGESDQDDHSSDQSTESASPDEELQPPANWQFHLHLEQESDSDCELRDLGQPAGQEEVQKDEADMQSEACEEKEEDGQIVRPRGKLTAPEWVQVVSEGWVSKMPTVPDSTLGRHSQKGAWSARYPGKGGPQYCSRSFGTLRTPVCALLQCMAWLVSTHAKTVVAEREHWRALARELSTRASQEELTLALFFVQSHGMTFIVHCLDALHTWC